jgi:dihydroorotate dehydrogenase electron transfer subunit
LLRRIGRGREIRTIETAAVVRNHEVAQNTFVTKFSAPGIAPLVKPGQFVMVSFPGCLDPLLARAFSVSDVQGANLSLLYSAVGKGTTRLSRLKRGEVVVINGPLGNGFPELSKGEKIWVVVGGSGAALVPIFFKAAKRAGADMKIFYGARTKLQLVTFGTVKPNLATDDGSVGYHGTALGLLNHHLKKEKPDAIFGCGPTPMLVGLKLSIHDLPVFVSVETPMACGMGFCQGCPVKIKNSSDYFLACKDGPVFDAREIEIG